MALARLRDTSERSTQFIVATPLSFESRLEQSIDLVMKAVILAGGLGTWISEETHLKPKPMNEIGGEDLTIRELVDVVAEVT